MSGVWTRDDAGAFAQQRFRRRVGPWRARVQLFFPVAAAGMVAWLAFCHYVLQVHGMQFLYAFGAGAVMGSTLVMWDSPPVHVETWRLGAAGEKATKKQLTALAKRGWFAVHDVEHGGRGNIDHVLVGPAGVFVLESKNFAGTLSVSRGVLRVEWRADPGYGMDRWWIGPNARRAASLVRGKLADAGISLDVTPVVVLWGHFEQEPIRSGEVVWTAGKDLRRALERQSAVLTSDAVERITSVFRGWEQRTNA